MIAELSRIEGAIWLLACALFVFLSAVFSGSETGLYCLNRTRLRLAANRGETAAIRLLDLLRDEGGLLFTTLLGTNAANYLAPVCLTVVFLGTINADSTEERDRLAELYTTLILTPTVFILGEVVPKNVFQRNADSFMRRISHLLAPTHRLFQYMGLIWIQRRMTAFVLSRIHRSPMTGSALHPRLEVYELLREEAATGTLSRTQASMLERIQAVENTRISAVMVPRAKMVMIEENMTRTQIDNVVRGSRVWRFPVYRKDPRDVIGVVHLLDILTAEETQTLSDWMHTPLTIRHDVSVLEAISIMRQNHRRMAIITDTTGRCMGLATVKDLVEEIVGELTLW